MIKRVFAGSWDIRALKRRTTEFLLFQISLNADEHVV